MTKAKVNTDKIRRIVEQLPLPHIPMAILSLANWGLSALISDLGLANLIWEHIDEYHVESTKVDCFALFIDEDGYNCLSIVLDSVETDFVFRFKDGYLKGLILKTFPDMHQTIDFAGDGMLIVDDPNAPVAVQDIWNIVGDMLHHNLLYIMQDSDDGNTTNAVVTIGPMEGSDDEDTLMLTAPLGKEFSDLVSAIEQLLFPPSSNADPSSAVFWTDESPNYIN